MAWFMISKIFSSAFLLLGLVLLLAIVEVPALAEDRTRIGLVEDVILLPWKIRLPARVDTGAGMSSLDAREIVIQDNMAEFRFPAKYGGLSLRVPIVDWQTIRSAEGRERRPVVEIDLCIGSRGLRARFNLNESMRHIFEWWNQVGPFKGTP